MDTADVYSQGEPSQIVGADDRVLALARAYQQATGWCYVPPPGVDVRSS